MSTKHRTVLALAVCAAAGLIIGVIAWRAALPVAQAADAYRPADSATAAIIGERATQYWQARTRQDLYAAYPFYEARFRAAHQPEAFVRTFQRLNRFSPALAGVERIEIDASGTRAQVLVKLRSRPQVLEGKEIVTTTEDVWLLGNGTWWRKAEALAPSL